MSLFACSHVPSGVIRIVVATLAAAFAVPAPAQWPAPIERALSRRYHVCMASGAAAAGVTGAMVTCSGDELDRQDARLNRAYRMTLQRLSAPRQARLRSAQRSWHARRDPGCDRRAGREGTIVPLNYSQCLLRETVARRLWLERYR